MNVVLEFGLDGLGNGKDSREGQNILWQECTIRPYGKVSQLASAND
jgi:hypothetical protein